jgi:hypothetical protein
MKKNRIIARLTGRALRLTRRRRSGGSAISAIHETYHRYLNKGNHRMSKARNKPSQAKPSQAGALRAIEDWGRDLKINSINE